MLASCWTRADRAAMFWPRLKNVAGTPYRARIDTMLAVLAPGPSSKVRATVLPLPGAALFAPYGVAAAAGAAKAPIAPRAIAAASSRNRVADITISKPVPAVTSTARRLCLLLLSYHYQGKP